MVLVSLVTSEQQHDKPRQLPSSNCQYRISDPDPDDLDEIPDVEFKRMVIDMVKELKEDFSIF